MFNNYWSTQDEENNKMFFFANLPNLADSCNERGFCFRAKTKTNGFRGGVRWVTCVSS